MERIVSVIYDFMANILIYAAEFPGDMKSAGSGLLFGGAAVWIVISIMLVIAAIRSNNGSYKFPVKVAVGGIWIFSVMHYAVFKLAGLNIAKSVPFYHYGIAGLIFLGAIVFAVINFLLDFVKGKTTVLLWTSEFLFAASVIRFWRCIEGTSPKYERIMVVSKIVDSFTLVMKKLGLQGISGIFESVILILLMFITVCYLFRAKHYMPDEWLICLIAQIASGVAYLLYEVHTGIEWRVDQAFIIFLLFCTGWIVHIIIFVYEIAARKQDGCIGAFLAALSGLTWSCAIVFAVDVAKKGALGQSLNRISSVMTKVYQAVPYGVQMELSKNKLILSVLSFLIALVLTVLSIIVLFVVLGKVLNFSETGVGMGVEWFQNCSLVLAVPIVIYWTCSMYGNLFGESYSWISLMIQSLAGIGLALCFSNMAPAIKKGFLGQLKLIVISMVGSLLVICILIPVVLALIL